MTKIMIPSFGWIYLHVMIDWETKKLLSCQACSELGIHQIFASCSNLKGDAGTGRVIRTIRKDLV